MAITVQSTYLTDYVPGFPGMLADGNVTNRPSGTVEDSAGIAFGKAAFQGTADRGLTATPGTKFKGITIANAGVVAPVRRRGGYLPAICLGQRCATWAISGCLQAATSRRVPRSM
jgi:hypothetical protein